MLRIVHTADWHLGHRLGRVDRGPDLRRAVAEIASICQRESADVLLVCGDLFSEMTRADTLRMWMEFLNQALGPFMCGGGTVVALTGNHDNDNFAQMLGQAMTLAAPAPNEPGARLRPGRFYLFTSPSFFRLAARDGQDVQFVVMPSPTPTRYLSPEELHRYPSREEQNRAIRAAFSARIREYLAHPAFEPGRPAVLAAHILTRGAEVAAGVRVSESGGVMVAGEDLPTRQVAYVALGDVHRPQALMNLPHVRYSGSIERMDLGEAGDEKGVDVVDVGPAGLLAPPRRVPLAASPIYRVVIDDPPTQMRGLADKYPDRDSALVSLALKYRAGRDSLNDLLAELDAVFPRCYARDWEETGGPAAGDDAGRDGDAHGGAGGRRSFRDVVTGYVAAQLDGQPDRDEVLKLVEELLTAEE